MWLRGQRKGRILTGCRGDDGDRRRPDAGAQRQGRPEVESGACVGFWGGGANDPREVVTQARKSGDRRGEVASRTQEQKLSDAGSTEEVDRR